MSFYEWNDKLSVNVRTIDEQHKQLVAMINDLHDAMKNRKASEIITKIVNELKDYARKHFTTEEELMTKHTYPEFNEHRVEHDKFIEKVLDFDMSCEEGACPVPMELANFLRHWLNEHIMGTDKKMGPFFNEKGVF